MFRKLLLLPLVLLIIDASHAQSEWKLRQEEDGITAYTRSVEGIKFDEYKVEMTIQASMSAIMAIFKDFEIYPDLFPGTKNIKVFLDEPDHHVTYIKFDLPFPARDRDGVFDNRIKYNKSQGNLIIDVNCLADKYDTDSDLVRIEYCQGGWSFTQLAGNKIKVEHNLVVNPGGLAPAFIVNSKLTKDPIKTLQQLRARISDDKYQGKTFALLTQ